MLVPFFASSYQPASAHRPVYTGLREDITFCGEISSPVSHWGSILLFAHIHVPGSLCFVTVGGSSPLSMPLLTGSLFLDEPGGAMVQHSPAQAAAHQRFLWLDHLAERLHAFVAEWNTSAHPFNWSSKSGTLVMAKCSLTSPTLWLQRSRLFFRRLHAGHAGASTRSRPDHGPPQRARWRPPRTATARVPQASFIPCAGMKLVPTKTTTIPSIQASALASTQQPAFGR